MEYIGIGIVIAVIIAAGIIIYTKFNMYNTGTLTLHPLTGVLNLGYANAFPR